MIPADHVVRRPSLADSEAILDLVRTADIALLGYHEYGTDEVREDLTAPGAEMDRDHWLILDAGGTAVGWAYLREERPGGAWADDYVRPGADPALQPWLLETVRTRAAERAVEAGVPAYELLTGAYVQDTARSAALAAAGFEVARRFFRMAVELIPGYPQPAPPDGIDVRVAGNDEAGRHAMHHVMQVSFVDHWDFHPEDYDAWWLRQSTGAGFAPDQWWVAYDGDEPVAAALCSDRMAEEGIGYVRGLGTVATHRGRGLGRLLLRHAFADFARRGRTRAQLGVDTRNSTGALHVYESVGMRPAVTVDTWSLSVPAAAPVA